MRIYIASSWRNQHAIEMLTRILRDHGHHVLSSIEYWQAKGLTTKGHLTANDVVAADEQFDFDMHSAITTDVAILISPSGCDSWAQIGASWAKGVPIYGLRGQGENDGLMRRMVYMWFDDYRQLLNAFPQAGTTQEADHLELIRRTKSQANARTANSRPVPGGVENA